MMKKITQNTLFLMLAFASTFINAQIDVTFDNTATTISHNGELNAPVIVTISNIPNGTAASTTINSRIYTAGSAVSGGGHVSNFSNSDFNLDENFADIDNGTLKTETTLNSPSAGHFTRVYTIKKYPAGDISTITSADVAIRFVGASSLTFVQTKETGGNANNASFRLNTNLTVATTLSSKNFNLISKSIYPNPVRDVLTINSGIKTERYKVVNLLGKTVKNEKATGTINVSDLSNGMYLLVTDAGSAKFVKN